MSSETASANLSAVAWARGFRSHGSLNCIHGQGNAVANMAIRLS